MLVKELMGSIALLRDACGIVRIFLPQKQGMYLNQSELLTLTSESLT